MPRLPIPGATCLALALALALPAFQAQAQMSPEPRSRAMELMRPCRPDVQQYCSSVQRGGGRILACLRSHEQELGAACRQAMARISAMRTGAGR